MLKKILLSVVFLLVCVPHVFAQQASPSAEPQKTPEERYYQADVIDVIDQGQKEQFGVKSFFQLLKVRITSGDEEGREVLVEHGGVVSITPQQHLDRNDEIVLVKTIGTDGRTQYSILDRYRANNVLYILLAFAALVIFVAGKKGIGSIIGLVISIFVILKFIVPQILAGHDPVLVSVAGSLMILVTTIYVAHGISKQTTVAVIGTFLALIITGLLGMYFVEIAFLSGLGSENSYLLQFGPTAINIKGLLLGGIIIGALGVLDDITTTQSAAVFELAKTGEKTFSSLFTRGFTIGKEHVVSLVNTLVLAYAGASLSLFILFVLNPSNQPYWVILNSEVITEEVIRTIAGSIGLVLAVPITTAIAAWIASYLPQKKKTNRNSRNGS